jgi:peptide/nickel transport system permease protein
LPLAATATFEKPEDVMIITNSVGRLTRIAFVMLGVSIVVFGLIQLAPGDVATALLGPQASEAAKAALREQLGLDRSIITQYWLWLASVLQGDFGNSIISRSPVLAEVVPRYLNSLLLATAALLVAVTVGVSAGIVSAARPGSIFDRVSLFLVQVFGSLPPFWLGLVLVYFFALQFRLLPATGMTKSFGGGDAKDIALHLILPAVTAAAASTAVIVRMVRAVFLDVMAADYMTVARARGVGTARLLTRHALPNCLPHILTIVGLQLGYLIGGVLFTEVVFAWPGIGQFLYQAILGRDIAVVQACVLFIAFSFVLINLVVDLFNDYLSSRTHQS